MNLTKSKILKGLQCEKHLYLQQHFSHLATKPTPAEKALFEQGYLVQREAEARFPEGILIKAKPWEQRHALEQTKRALESGAKTLFEPAFSFDGVFTRVDILNHTSDGWDLIEVKSSTSVKQEHIMDLAVQVYVLESLGISLNRKAVWHLNKECRYPDLSNLFEEREFSSEELFQSIRTLEGKLDAFRTMLNAPEAPAQSIGAHCSSPHQCPFTAHCWKDLPSPSIFDLPRKNLDVWSLFEQGVVELKDERLPAFLSVEQKVQLDAVLGGTRFISVSGIKSGLENWQWPLYFLDFETIAFAIPRYEKTRPYQAIPFQFSCLRQESKGASFKSFAFLHLNELDPRKEFAERLLECLGETGSIVAYYKEFEISRIKELMEFLPQYSQSFEVILERFVDPLPIFRSSVYDKAFRGSFSIKSVAPGILGNQYGYDELLVQDGLQAQIAFSELIEPSSSEQKKAALKKALLEYCHQDTMVMARLVDWLYSQA